MTQNEVRRHFEKQILILFNKNVYINSYPLLFESSTDYLYCQGFLPITVTDT